MILLNASQPVDARIKALTLADPALQDKYDAEGLFELFDTVDAYGIASDAECLEAYVSRGFDPRETQPTHHDRP